MKDLRKAAGASLLVLAALLLTFKFKAALGWSPDFILPVLAAAGFLLDIYALAFLTFVALWVLNWQAGLPMELLILAAAPLSAWLGKKFLPSAHWLTLSLIILIGEILLYVSAAPGVFLPNAGFIISNVIFAVFFGLSIAKLLEWVYEKN